MTGWKYEVLHIYKMGETFKWHHDHLGRAHVITNEFKLVEDLNKIGEDGWELISIDSPFQEKTSSGEPIVRRFVFKRPS